MRKGLVTRLGHGASKRILNAQIRGFNKAFSASTKLSLKDSSENLVLPICVSTGFGNISWKTSWKTRVIERLHRADGGMFLDVGANVGQPC